MATAAPTTAENRHKPRKSRVLELSLVFLLVAGFSLATNLDQWFQNWIGNRADSSNLIGVALGDARRMFANHFFVKADAYFHSGFYPTIYDNLQSVETPHIAEDAGAAKSKNTGDEDSFLGTPQNWIDAFGRQFFPSTHTHLTEGGANGEENLGTVREILPWLKLSSELDPKHVETYVTTAYWLRRMGKVKEAEDFLREGLHENPGDPYILFDLGRIFYEYRHDPVRARNVWEAGLRNLAKLPQTDENKYVAEQILTAMAHMEEQQKNFEQTLQWLEKLKAIAVEPIEIQTWMDKVRKEMGK